MSIEEIPVAAVVIVIAWPEFDIVEAQRFPLVRRRCYLHFNRRLELRVARPSGCRPRDRRRPKEVPRSRVQFRG